MDFDGFGIYFHFVRWCCLHADFQGMKDTSIVESIVLGPGPIKLWGPVIFSTGFMSICRIVDSSSDRVLSTNSVIEFILCFTYLTRQLSNQYPIGRARCQGLMA